jgi:hypothetical protein
MSIGQWHDPVDICDLDYFLACYKAGSFTAVARDAHIAPAGPYQAPSPGWSEILGATVRPGNHAVALTEHG